MSDYSKLFKELEKQIQQSYVEGVTLDEAEKLAGKTLHAQILISKELQTVSLDARMRKSGVKSIRSAVYLSEIQRNEKKPTEALLEATINSNEIVQKEQDELDKSEVNREELQRQYDILLNAHIFFRGIAKGKFE